MALAWLHSPFSLSDLFSCSVSVRVRTEFERLDKQELRPDFTPLPQRRMARSGDITPSFSVSTSEPAPTEEKPRWGRPISAQKARPRRVAGSHIPSCLRLKFWPVKEMQQTNSVYTASITWSNTNNLQVPNVNTNWHWWVHTTELFSNWTVLFLRIKTRVSFNCYERMKLFCLYFTCKQSKLK